MALRVPATGNRAAVINALFRSKDTSSKDIHASPPQEIVFGSAVMCVYQSVEDTADPGSWTAPEPTALLLLQTAGGADVGI